MRISGDSQVQPDMAATALTEGVTWIYGYPAAVEEGLGRVVSQTKLPAVQPGQIGSVWNSVAHNWHVSRAIN